MLTTIKSPVQRLVRSESGVAATEFALVLPFMAMIYFGAIETSFLVQADRRVTSASSTMADLVTRVDQVTFAEAENVFLATAKVVRPDDTNGLHMRMTSVVEVDGKPVVDWSQGRNLPALSAGDTVTLPPGILPAGASVIVAEITYDFNSSMGYFIPGTKELADRFFLRPRQVDTIDFIGDETGPTNATWTPTSGGNNGGDAAKALWDDGDADTNPDHAGGWYGDGSANFSTDDADTNTGSGGNTNCDGYGNCGVGNGGGGGNGTDNEGNGNGNGRVTTMPTMPGIPSFLGSSGTDIANSIIDGLKDGSLTEEGLIALVQAQNALGMISDDDLDEAIQFIRDLADYVEDLVDYMDYVDSQNLGDDDDEEDDDRYAGYPSGQADSPLDNDQGKGNDGKLDDYLGADNVALLEKAIFDARLGNDWGATDEEVLAILATLEAIDEDESSLHLDTSVDKGMGALLEAITEAEAAAAAAAIDPADSMTNAGKLYRDKLPDLEYDNDLKNALVYALKAAATSMPGYDSLSTDDQNNIMSGISQLANGFKSNASGGDGSSQISNGFYKFASANFFVDLRMTISEGQNGMPVVSVEITELAPGEAGFSYTVAQDKSVNDTGFLSATYLSEALPDVQTNGNLQNGVKYAIQSALLGNADYQALSSSDQTAAMAAANNIAIGLRKNAAGAMSGDWYVSVGLNALTALGLDLDIDLSISNGPTGKPVVTANFAESDTGAASLSYSVPTDFATNDTGLNTGSYLKTTLPGIQTNNNLLNAVSNSIKSSMQSTPGYDSLSSADQGKLMDIAYQIGLGVKKNANTENGGDTIIAAALAELTSMNLPVDISLDISKAGNNTPIVNASLSLKQSGSPTLTYTY